MHLLLHSSHITDNKTICLNTNSLIEHMNASALVIKTVLFFTALVIACRSWELKTLKRTKSYIMYVFGY